MIHRVCVRISFLLVIAFLFFSSIIHAQGTTSSTTSSTTTNSATTATSQHGSQTSSGASGSVASGSHVASQSQQSQSSVSVNPVDAPGGVTMLTPAATLASSTFYKIGATITFSWSYTSVQVTPSQIALQAYCATNKFYYPVATNLPYSDTLVEWDTGAYDANATIPLLTAMYTLYIFDESRAVTAIPQAGILGSYLGFAFGMYQPQPYTPLPTNTCVICSDARTLLPKGIWWSLGIGAAFVLGGWRVLIG